MPLLDSIAYMIMQMKMDNYLMTISTLVARASFLGILRDWVNLLGSMAQSYLRLKCQMFGKSEICLKCNEAEHDYLPILFMSGLGSWWTRKTQDIMGNILSWNSCNYSGDRQHWQSQDIYYEGWTLQVAGTWGSWTFCYTSFCKQTRP